MIFEMGKISSLSNDLILSDRDISVGRKGSRCERKNIYAVDFMLSPSVFIDIFCARGFSKKCYISTSRSDSMCYGRCFLNNTAENFF